MGDTAVRKQISTKKIIALCCGDAGRAFIYGIIASYLMVFFIPSESTLDFPVFIPNAGLVFGIIYGLGIVWDAISDPIVASLTDRFQHKDDRHNRRCPRNSDTRLHRINCMHYFLYAV